MHFHQSIIFILLSLIHSLRKHPFVLALRRQGRFARGKRPQRRRARTNGCFRRLLDTVICKKQLPKFVFEISQLVSELGSQLISYQLVWSRVSSDNMDCPSPVTLIQHCRFEFTDSGKPGVLEQSVYVRGLRSSSLSLSVLCLPQHQLRYHLLFVPTQCSEQHFKLTSQCCSMIQSTTSI